MKKKKLIVFVVTAVAILSCISVPVLAAASQKIWIDETCGPETYPLNNTPEILYKDNLEILTSIAQSEDSLSPSKVVSLDDILSVEDVELAGGEIISANYMTYNDFVNGISTIKGRSMQIGENRVVLVVEIFYPKGFEHVKAGIIENCLAVGVYDAATGEYLGGEYTTVDEEVLKMMEQNR